MGWMSRCAALGRVRTSPRVKAAWASRACRTRRPCAPRCSRVMDGEERNRRRDEPSELAPRQNLCGLRGARQRRSIGVKSRWWAATGRPSITQATAEQLSGYAGAFDLADRRSSGDRRAPALPGGQRLPAGGSGSGRAGRSAGAHARLLHVPFGEDESRAAEPWRHRQSDRASRWLRRGSSDGVRHRPGKHGHRRLHGGALREEVRPEWRRSATRTRVARRRDGR